MGARVDENDHSELNGAQVKQPTYIMSRPHTVAHTQTRARGDRAPTCHLSLYTKRGAARAVCPAGAPPHLHLAPAPWHSPDWRGAATTRSCCAA